MRAARSVFSSLRFAARRAPVGGVLAPTALRFGPIRMFSDEIRPQEPNIYDLIEKSVPKESLAEVKRLLYGGVCQDIAVTEKAQGLSEANDFEIRAFKLPEGHPEQLRARRVVRVGAIQNMIVKETTEPIFEQRDAIYKVVAPIVEAAAAMGVNVLGLQETWPCPFFFCTRERMPWVELAESAQDGPSVQLCQKWAKKYDMVIVCPILERDHEHNEIIWNTAVVIGNNGNIIGKHRKNHIPRVGDFNESTFYMEGNTGHPVFQTAFGKVAVNICYGRHFAQNWRMFGLNGAEIVFNPSATVDSLSETLWPLEARTAAVWNNYFTVAINRVGSETFANEFTSGDGKKAHHVFGHFYGSSFVTGPNSCRTPPASRVRNSLLVAEIDLNQCRQIKDSWNFPMCARDEMYAKLWEKAVSPGFQPQVIVDPTLIEDEDKPKKRK